MLYLLYIQCRAWIQKYFTKAKKHKRVCQHSTRIDKPHAL